MLEAVQALYHEVKRQNTIGYVFTRGLIYGVGFVIGTTIVATIAIGVFRPLFDKVAWVRDNYLRGAELTQ